MEEMTKTVKYVAVLVLLMGTAAACAQGSCTFTDENGKTVTWKDCKPPSEDTTQSTPAGKSQTPASDVPPAKAFPFPGESQPQTAVPVKTPSVATQPANGTNLPPSKKFPFPGESPAAAAPDAGPLQDAGSSGESSSSSSSSSGGTNDSNTDTADNDAAAKAAAARHAARGRSLAPKQTPAQREDEDLTVASFYMNDKDYKGAYLRALDAVSIAADDPDAHLALAEAARKLGKLDEAEKHYKLCLTLDPVPKVKKAAQAALKEMSGG
jgi:hypothetical protein